MKRPLLLIFALAAVVYATSLQCGFVLDDYQHIVRNENLAHPSYSFFTFTQPTWPGNLYRPLVVASYVVTFTFVKLQPWLYHLTNILLHAFVCVSLTLVIAQLFDRRRAIFIGVLFAVLPIHLEAVVGISNRTELLAALFGLLSLYYLLRSAESAQGDWRERAATGVFFFFALCSKESAIVFIPLFLICLLLKFGRRAAILLFARHFAWMLLPLAAYLALRMQALGGTLNSPYAISFVDNPLAVVPVNVRVSNAMKLLGDYIRLSFFPTALSADYSYAKMGALKDLSGSSVLIAQFLVVVFLSTMAFGLKHKKVMAFWCAWFFVSFIVTSNIFFPIGTIFAERLAYLPSVGLIGFAVELLVGLRRPRLEWFAVAAVTVVFSVIVVRETRYWRSSASLYQKEIQLSPLSVKMQHNYGAALLEQGDIAGAEPYFKKALEIYPKYYPSARGLAGVAQSRGDVKAQGHWLLQAVEMNPRFVPALEDLGWLYLKFSNVKRAGEVFEQALKVDPSSYYALLGRMAVYTRVGELEKAKSVGQRLLRRQPSDLNLINEFNRLKRAEAAAAGAAPKTAN